MITYTPLQAGEASPDRRSIDPASGAYHQGTVWAWLLGHFALAEYRAFGDADLAQSRLAAMRDHIFDAGLGTISEVFEAEPSRLPAGALSQAWSVACVIEAWWRIEQAKGLAGRA